VLLGMLGPPLGLPGSVTHRQLGYTAVTHELIFRAFVTRSAAGSSFGAGSGLDVFTAAGALWPRSVSFR